MLGDKGVGKSTIIKQFRMMNKDLFSFEEISKFRKNILKNVYNDHTSRRLVTLIARLNLFFDCTG